MHGILSSDMATFVTLPGTTNNVAIGVNWPGGIVNGWKRF